MRNSFYLLLGMLVAALAPQSGTAQDKPAASGTVKVKVEYKGSGTVDDKHHILMFLFDKPFTSGDVIPFATEHATSKKQTVTFSDVSKSPVYIATVYDPAGAYEGMSQPPSGASLGMYSKTPGQPDPVEIKEGKTVEVELTFDDSQKMP